MLPTSPESFSTVARRPLQNVLDETARRRSCLLHGGGEGLAVVRLGDGAGAYRHRIAVNEIEVGAVIDAAEQMVARLRGHLVPAHVRQRQAEVGHLLDRRIDEPSVVTPPFSSLLAASSCMPRQMPSTGCVQALISSIRSRSRS